MSIKFIMAGMFSVMLAGCADTDGSEVSTAGDEQWDIPEKNVSHLDSFKLKTASAGDDDEGAATQGPALPGEPEDMDQADLNNVVKHGGEDALDTFTGDARDIESSIKTIWQQDFYTIYNDTNPFSAAGIDEASMEEIASEIDSIHDDYETLKEDLHDITIPKTLPEPDQETLESVLGNLEMALDNRALALIELELMYSEDEPFRHNELLNIHVGNSDEYLEKANDHLRELETSGSDG